MKPLKPPAAGGAADDTAFAGGRNRHVSRRQIMDFDRVEIISFQEITVGTACVVKSVHPSRLPPSSTMLLIRFPAFARDPTQSAVVGSAFQSRPADCRQVGMVSSANIKLPEKMQ